jgi:signal transduction histidine kinase
MKGTEDLHNYWRLFPLLTRGFVHDLNNGLNGLRGYDLLLKHRLLNIDMPEADKKFIEEMEDNSEISYQRISRMIGYFLRLSRAFSTDTSRDILITNVHEVIKTIKKDKHGEKNKLQLKIKGANRINVLPIPVPFFTLIIDEIINNSAKIADQSDKPITLTISLSFFPEKSLLKIVGKDSGPGYPENILQAKDLPEFSGLSFLSQISRQMGGWMVIANDKNGGAKIEVVISTSSIPKTQ